MHRDHSTDLAPDLELEGAGGDRALTIDDELADRDRQLETGRSRAARADEEHAVALRHHRLVRVPRDDDANARGARVDIELGQVVDGVQVHAPNLEQLGFAYAFGPWTRIVIPAHGRDRSNGGQLFEHTCVAD